jgi:hypothetical protein
VGKRIFFFQRIDATTCVIVSQLLGGLGNQLFQYSLGRCLAEKTGTRLKLDTSAFSDYRLRPYALHHFRTQADVLTASELRQLGIAEPAKGILGVWRQLRGSSIPVVSEPSFEFDPTILDIRGPCYLKGYWQSPKYFASVESLIRRELTVSSPLDGQNEAVGNRIRASLAVAVHVRRGDYVTSAETNRYHGSCSAEYYYAAEEILRRRVGQLSLFVFSDDPQWAKENMRFSSPNFVVSHNSLEHGHEDLRLMTMCQHHVIANSTFSWWGAWLCVNPGKIVVAPRNWFRDAGHSTADLIPEDWIRV